MPSSSSGLLIIAAGVIALLDNFGVLDGGAYFRYWPVGLIAIGLARFRQARGGAGRLGASVFVAAGVWLLLDSFGIVDVSVWQLWPVLLVLFGASWCGRGCAGVATAASGRSTRTPPSAAWRCSAAGQRGNNSRSFRGGDLTAVMGGCEIDLRQAAIDGEAVIDVFAHVGRHRDPGAGGLDGRRAGDAHAWRVRGQDAAVRRAPAAHRLVMRGFAIMGGIEMKN